MPRDGGHGGEVRVEDAEAVEPGRDSEADPRVRVAEEACRRAHHALRAGYLERDEQQGVSEALGPGPLPAEQADQTHHREHHHHLEAEPRCHGRAPCRPRHDRRWGAFHPLPDDALVAGDEPLGIVLRDLRPTIRGVAEVLAAREVVDHIPTALHGQRDAQRRVDEEHLRRREWPQELRQRPGFVQQVIRALQDEQQEERLDWRDGVRDPVDPHEARDSRAEVD